MDKERYKELKTRNNGNDLNFLFEYYIEEPHPRQKINREDFEQLFKVFVMMNGGMQRIINNLDNKYK